RKELLDGANLLLVPIFNVDGHERASPYARINQRGPSPSGWRTTARNLNLNRDYGKLDPPETRALVGALDRWAPDLFLDIHVTDGIDYQYDVTFGHNASGWSPAICEWPDNKLTPAGQHDLTAWTRALVYRSHSHRPIAALAVVRGRRPRPEQGHRPRQRPAPLIDGIRRRAPP